MVFALLGLVLGLILPLHRSSCHHLLSRFHLTRHQKHASSIKPRLLPDDLGLLLSFDQKLSRVWLISPLLHLSPLAELTWSFNADFFIVYSY